MNPIVLFSLICLVTLYLAKYAQSWLVRIRLGLPGPPPPLPYIGDIWNLLNQGATNQHEQQLKMLKRYGRNVATTSFGNVYVLISDPEVIKAVTIKNFDYFTGVAAPGLQLKNPPYSSMISISGHRWRRIRNTISPIFTTSMLKHMMTLMRSSLATLISKVEKAAEGNKMVDVHQYIKQATMEIVVKTSFSIEANSQTCDDDPFLKNAEKALTSVRLIQLLASLPLGDHLVSLLADPCNFEYMLQVARGIIKQRRQGVGIKNRDFVQLLLQTQDNIEEDKKLSENEILAQSLIFLMAGFDSTSSAGAFLIYCMSLYPEIQEKVRAEIDNVWKDANTEQLTYEMLKDLPYLHMCYQESQRLYSVAHITTRLCAEDCEIEGIPFKRGMVAVLPIYATHRLPELWPDPEKFIPERFTSEENSKRDPYIFMPFGHGPRNCVGMRFATLNVKMLVVGLLKRFVVRKTDKTMDPIVFESTFILNLPVGSTTVEFKKRSK